MTIINNKAKKLNIKTEVEPDIIHKDKIIKRSFFVRTMEIGDLADVYNLGEMSFKPDLWPMLYRSWDEYEVTTLFNTDGDYCLVAENDDESNAEKNDRIVGFVLGSVISKTGSAWNYGYIIWLCAHPDWQREGVASKLVDKLVEIMIEEGGIRILMADTDPENQKAVKFFHRKGFTTEKPHIYLSTNLEHNENYSHLIQESREAAMDAEYIKKIRRLAEDGKTLHLSNLPSTLSKKKKKKKTKLRLKSKAKLKTTKLKTTKKT